MSSASPTENPSQNNSKTAAALAKEATVKRKQRFKHLDAIITVASNWLYNQSPAKDTLAYLDKRMSREQQSILKFGYFPRNWEDVLLFMDDLSEVLPKEDPKNVLEENGIIELRARKPKNFYYNNPLLIPFYDVYGNPVSIVGRTLLSEQELKQTKISKYKNLPFQKSKHLFGLNLSWRKIVELDYVLIVEGQFDFITSFLYGYENSVALCGSKVILEQLLLLKRYTKNFYFILDNDEAGEKGWNAINNKASKYDIFCHRIELTQGKDVDECLRSGNTIVFPKPHLLRIYKHALTKQEMDAG